MADMDSVFQVEMRRQSGQGVGIVIHILAVAGLGRAPVATAVMGNNAIAVMQEEQHLRVPVIGRQRPAMAEHDGLTRTPVLVIDLDPVFCRYRGADAAFLGIREMFMRVPWAPRSIENILSIGRISRRPESPPRANDHQ